MIAAIHQPNFLPWLGYFYKIARADVFVFLDSVQYIKEGFTNRNRIKTQTGVQWLTVPVWKNAKSGQAIQDVLTAGDTDWRRKHLRVLEGHYRAAPHFSEFFGLLEKEYTSVETRTSLADFNIAMIRAVCDYLKIAPDFIRARDLKANGKSTQLLVNICRELGADCYLAGGGAHKYQDDEQFAAAGIQIQFSDFQPEPYSQLWGPFVKGLSVIDTLMNCGPSARALLTRNRSEAPYQDPQWAVS